MLEQHEDQAQSVKSSSSAESRSEKKFRVEAHNAQGQIVKEDLSSEDDEGHLERRSADQSKLEELLKSDFKQEETKRSLNGLKKQQARTRPAL
ncbi:hypothetical protein F511_26849 [Dorcoceras hygrometricum]|uniref:Uncharacterized protein n=1 Tax=Dorcoceras hygrometricum TaxID=472368 RepID=A0A2Z7APR4_9LAMI|nr:hypothetical protein F511_26849 [Dorcoceras hygrometricum]